MAKQYSIAEARINLPRIVDRAEAGFSIELTRRGKPVAVVISVPVFERLQGGRTKFGDAYKAFRKKYSLKEAGLEAGFAASLRAAGGGRKVDL